MDTQPRRVVQVRKYGDLINVADTTLKTRDEQIAELVNIHGAENVLIDGVSFAEIERHRAAQNAVAGPEPVKLSAIQPETMQIGEREVPQIDVIRAILENSKLSVEEWNALEDADREHLISEAVKAMEAQ